jgi:hypothetical protein
MGEHCLGLSWASQKPHFSQRTREMGHRAFWAGREKFLDDCRIPIRPFDYMVKAGQLAATSLQEEDSTHFKEENNAQKN